MDIYYETLFNFFVGGLVIGSITFCVRHLTPELGALVWAAPVLLLPSIILLYYHGEPNDKLAYFTILAFTILNTSSHMANRFLFNFKSQRYYRQ